MDDVLETVSNADYHAAPAISSSWLKLLDSRSAWHVWKRYIDPNREQLTAKQTKALKHGRLTHTLVLEPDKLESEYVIVPDEITKRSKDGKAFLEELEAGPLCMVKQKDYEECKLLAAALRSNPGFIANRQCEHVNERTYKWDDDEYGLACKFRPDTLIFPCSTYPNGAVIDVKTSVDAGLAGFGRQFFNLGYHIQAAHYATGMMHALNLDDVPAVIFEVVEKSEPYPTQCYRVPDRVLEYGMSERSRLMNYAAECFSTNTWPGYSKDVFADLLVPGWIERQMEESGEIELTYVED